MSGLVTSVRVAALLRHHPRYANYEVVPDGHFESGQMRVRLMAPRTAFRQPKGAKVAPKEKAATYMTRGFVHHGFRKRKRNLNAEGSRDRQPRPYLDAARAIEEELFHARELADLEAIQSDGFEDLHNPRWEEVNTTVYTTGYTSTTNRDHLVADAQEAPMSSNTKPASIVTVRPGGARAKGRPWRTDVTILPEQTLVVEPQALSREDQELLTREPVDPTTRKATRIQPKEAHLIESVDWTVEDLVEDRRLVRKGA